MPDYAVPESVQTIAAGALDAHRAQRIEGVHGQVTAEALRSGTIDLDRMRRMVRFFRVNARSVEEATRTLRTQEDDAGIRSWNLHGGEPGRQWVERLHAGAVREALIPASEDVTLLFELTPDEVYDVFSCNAWRYEFGLTPATAGRFMEDYQAATGYMIDVRRAFGDAAPTVSSAIARRVAPPSPWRQVLPYLNSPDADYAKAAHEDAVTAVALEEEAERVKPGDYVEGEAETLLTTVLVRGIVTDIGGTFVHVVTGQSTQAVALSHPKVLKEKPPASLVSKWRRWMAKDKIAREQTRQRRIADLKAGVKLYTLDGKEITLADLEKNESRLREGLDEAYSVEYPSPRTTPPVIPEYRDSRKRKRWALAWVGIPLGENYDTREEARESWRAFIPAAEKIVRDLPPEQVRKALWSAFFQHDAPHLAPDAGGQPPSGGPLPWRMNEASGQQYTCPRCGSADCYGHEAHPDTGMDCFEVTCRSCHHSEEGGKSFRRAPTSRAVDLRGDETALEEEPANVEMFWDGAELARRAREANQRKRAEQERLRLSREKTRPYKKPSPTAKTQRLAAVPAKAHESAPGSLRGIRWAWLDPRGRWFRLTAPEQHLNFAEERLTTENALEKAGWVKLTDYTFMVPRARLTHEQGTQIRNWQQDNDQDGGSYIGTFLRGDEAEDLGEGIDDRYLFKATFLAGGPGSGKSYVADLSLRGTGARFLDQDAIFTSMLKAADLPLKLDPSGTDYEKQMALRARARKLIDARADLWLNGMLPVILDGTGQDYDRITGMAQKFREVGYDVSMLFVNTSLEVALARNRARSRSLADDVVRQIWSKVQANLGRFQAFFGPENFFAVDNSAVLKGAEAAAFSRQLDKVARRAIESPLRNPVGVETLRIMRERGYTKLTDFAREADEDAALDELSHRNLTTREKLAGIRADLDRAKVGAAVLDRFNELAEPLAADGGTLADVVRLVAFVRRYMNLSSQATRELHQTTATHRKRQKTVLGEGDAEQADAPLPPLRVFVDMDGVLSDFDAHYEETVGSSIADRIQEAGEAAAWQPIHAGGAQWWADMPPLPAGLEMWGTLEALAEEGRMEPPVILSSPGLAVEAATAGKTRWLVQHNVLRPPVSIMSVWKPGDRLVIRRDKAEVLRGLPPGERGRCVLIDDRAENIAAWEAAGGTGLHYTGDPAPILAELRATADEARAEDVDSPRRADQVSREVTTEDRELFASIKDLPYAQDLGERDRAVLGVIEGFLIVLVDGDKVNLVDNRFQGGGNGGVYQYIPKDEIWIDGRNLGTYTRPFFVFHEMVEARLMLTGPKLDYEDAHAIANAKEDVFRRENPP